MSESLHFQCIGLAPHFFSTPLGDDAPVARARLVEIGYTGKCDHQHPDAATLPNRGGLAQSPPVLVPGQISFCATALPRALGAALPSHLPG